MWYALHLRDGCARGTCVILAATLAACSLDDPASPEARPDTRSSQATAPVVATGTAAPAAVSNRFGYVWADQPTAASYTPNASYSYNATGGSIQITRSDYGTYRVSFTSPTGWQGSTYGFAITTYGSSIVGCSLRGHAISGPQLSIDVICSDPVTTVVADSRFTLLVVGSGSLSPRSAFAYANNPGAPLYTPDPLTSYTSGPASMTITIKHKSLPGVSNVNMGTGNPAHSTVLVGEAAGSAGDRCTAGPWHTQSFEVHCFGFDGLRLDKQHWVLQVDGGRPGRRLGFAWADQRTAASYTPNPNYSFNSSGGSVKVTRSGVGRYAVTFAGLQKLQGQTETVQVTPWGTGYSTCRVVNWGNAGGGLRVDVECRKLDLTLKDARFNVLVIE